jgi:hypothetical protein
MCLVGSEMEPTTTELSTSWMGWCGPQVRKRFAPYFSGPGLILHSNQPEREGQWTAAFVKRGDYGAPR